MVFTEKDWEKSKVGRGKDFRNVGRLGELQR